MLKYFMDLAKNVANITLTFSNISKPPIQKYDSEIMSHKL